MNVIPDRRKIGPERADGLVRVLAVERAEAACENGPAAHRLTEIAMTDGAVVDVEFFTGPDIAGPHGQALPVGANVDVPGGDFLGQRLAAEAVAAVPRGGGVFLCERQCGGDGHERGGEGERFHEFNRLRHFPPRLLR